MIEKKTQLTDEDWELVKKLKGTRTDREIYMKGLGVDVQPLKRGRPSLDAARKKHAEMVTDYNLYLNEKRIEDMKAKAAASTAAEDIENLFTFHQKRRRGQ